MVVSTAVAVLEAVTEIGDRPRLTFGILFSAPKLQAAQGHDDRADFGT